ncbi:MBL fold metallo-hydrolase [Gluconacetobacter diazotrophicus]|uniref:Putative beta-lactamase-like n=1 Tax=Gluconacetobacter diazotrophicus (strain ATCC 49037 / DSM 5601 / CCUG 37298 / CIP 103539 / LMG 7603 / PAl5) TaxID=272568 RepID=A9HIA8_GLUDA|nr:MBL fold metallo-hydrolase [Gluconacetobacter diazotrophicus]CAP55745.1 putative beta-lactamase-like [Gluconacetobacter diazotrophicus PA1 5]
MELIVLGCGGSAGVPMIGGPDGAGDWGVCDPAEPRNRRTRASVLLRGGDGAVLLDTGPDLRDQLLAQRIDRFDAILYTHAHADHIAGLDEVRAINRVIDRPLPVYGTPPVLTDLENRFNYAFRPWSPPGFYRPVVVPHVVHAGQTLEVAGLHLRLFEQIHGRTLSLGVRCGTIAYSTDVVELLDEAFAALAGIETWVVDCFQRSAAHSAHAWLDRVLEWRARIAPRRVILTHMGPDMDWAWMRANLPDGVEAAFDGMRVAFH